ncbi:nickel-binding protein [Pseudozobellia sp. WGM2]|uniref:nickel-binding protein n=1 Tax=Pseudozobellia sp. WGM2 TaxID=2787625 RepID=UPI001ADF37CB|nr:nickel-binding protein [Pseudozobellia sp. WGM2]
MPLYMDIHKVDSDDFTVEDVIKAHMQDLAIQESFGVIQRKYWVNEEDKMVFCLMEGPNKEACHKTHEESHGMTACNIIEVSDDEYNIFMSRGSTQKNDLAYTTDGNLDTGFRTIMLINTSDFSGKYRHYINETKRLIEKFRGKIVRQPNDDETMASFLLASDAIIAAMAIANLLHTVKDNFEYRLALVSGSPVDEEGVDLFEQTKKKVHTLCWIGLSKVVYLDAITQALSQKESNTPKVNHAHVKIVNATDFSFCEKLFKILNSEFNNSSFKSDDLGQLLGLSKAQTYRKIKSLTGMSPNTLIREMRLRRSLEALKKNGKTIAEIAYDLGFNSPTYFTRVFRKRYDILPTQFLKLSNTSIL